MDIFQAIILALVQGFSEFLPISSSAHLILVPKFFDWVDQGLAFDVAVHVGSLIAVVTYFRHDILELLRDFFASIKQRELVGQSNVAWGVIVATIPVCVAGLLLDNVIETYLRSELVIAISTIFFALVLWYADSKVGTKDLASLSIKMALIIGLFQAIALIPGTSRSGITLTAGLILGFSRSDSARFAFLLSIPVILIAGGYEGLKLLKLKEATDWGVVGVGVVFSAVSAYVCIYWFLNLISKISLLPFIVYRLILGAVLLAMVYV